MEGRLGERGQHGSAQRTDAGLEPVQQEAGPADLFPQVDQQECDDDRKEPVDDDRGLPDDRKQGRGAVDYERDDECG